MHETFNSVNLNNPEVISWNGVIAICTLLSSLGLIIDFGLRISNKQSILNKMGKWEIMIATMPIQEWKITVAKWAVSIWILLTKIICFDFNEKRDDTQKLLKAFPKTLKNISGIVGVLYKILLAISLSCCVLYLLIKVVNFFVIYRIPTLIIALQFKTIMTHFHTKFFITFPEFWTFNILTFALFIASFCFLLKFRESIISSYVFSTVFTITTLTFAFSTSKYVAHSFWFKFVHDSLVPTKPILLSLLNAPLDTLTLLVSIILLKFVISKGRYFVLIASIDILISAILALILHSLIMLIEYGSMSQFLNNLEGSYKWMLDVFSSFFSKKSLVERHDWPLIPLVLTPFIPVTIYMSIFIFLGVIVKPLLNFASYILGLLWEQKRTPFFLLGFVLSIIAILIKTFFDWIWLRNLLNNIF